MLLIFNSLGTPGKGDKMLLTLFIPDRDKEGNKIKGHSNWVKKAQFMMTLIGGGSTTTAAMGTWLDPQKKLMVKKISPKDLVWERTSIVQTDASQENISEGFNEFYKFVNEFGKNTSQGAVRYEIDKVAHEVSEYI